MKHIALTLAAIAFAPTSAFATTYGFGIAASKSPHLSLHVAPNNTDAYHFTGHYGSSFVQLTADFQRFYYPGWGIGSSYKCGLYSGAGMAGETRAEDTAREDYYLRFPFGIQANVPAVRLQAFLETAALLGSLPRTDVAATVATGIRAHI